MLFQEYLYNIFFEFFEYIIIILLQVPIAGFSAVGLYYSTGRTPFQEYLHNISLI